MARITSHRLHAPRISQQAKAILDATVKFAENSKHIRLHNMLISDFCNLSGLDVETPIQHVKILITEARRAVFSVKVVEVTKERKKEVLYGSWPIFSFVSMTKTHVSFEVCRYMRDDLNFGSV